MHIQKLQIQNLRVFQEVIVQPGPGLNFFLGDNGAGKTSLLEAIYLLGRARSFRHREAGPFIRKTADSCRVVASMVESDGKESILGIERGKRILRVRKDGKDLNKRSDLLRAMPLHLVTPHSHELVEKGPEVRRRFLDHGMFHVEHLYHELIFEYFRTLKQRNAALRKGDVRFVRSFDSGLADLARQVTSERENYVQLIAAEVRTALGELTEDFRVSIVMQPGWNPKESLVEQLKQKVDSDCRLGHTSVGPHRADLKILVDGVSAAKRLSRGQQKLLVYALKVAQCRVAMNKSGTPPVFLVDDIAAELDKKNLGKIIGLLAGLGIQTFVTTVNTDGFPNVADGNMFHVEHAGIREVPQ